MLTETKHRGTEAPRILAKPRLVQEPSRCLSVSVGRLSERRVWWLVAAAIMAWLSPLMAQQLLDRVVARVDGYAITLTDLQAALGLGIIQVPPGADPIDTATQQMIDRQLLLAEVQRFPPPEPGAAAVEGEVMLLRMRAGARLAALMESTGLTEGRIRDIARDDLRIADYLDQRFGTTVQVNGRKMTDLEFMKVVPGRHVVLVENARLRLRKQLTVDVKPNDKVTRDVNLVQ